MSILIKNKHFWRVYAIQAVGFGLIGINHLSNGKSSGYDLLIFSTVLVIASICSLLFGKRETSNRKYCHLIALISALIMIIRIYAY